MKIGIITVYNSPNFGSCWQARALYTKLIQMGHTPVMIDAGTRSVFHRIIKPSVLSISKAIVSLNIKKARFQYKRLQSFRNNYKSMKICADMSQLDNFDIVVLGSDEIWNVDRKEMRDFPIFWGKDVVCKKISYAPSINTATKESLLAYGVVELLKEMAAISVRDRWSREQLIGLTDRNISCVIDPTLLLEPNYYYNNFNATDFIKGKYIALYFFNFTEESKRLIKKIAAIMQMKIVSIGSWMDWCDYSVVDENPFIYYKNAALIITNTFHGTAFSINLSKDFICFTSGKQKIKELLDLFDLQNRAVDGLTVDDIVSVINHNIINWDDVTGKVNKERSLSEKYLTDSLL